MPSLYRRSRAIARRAVLSAQRSAPGRAIYSSRAALVLPRRVFRPLNAYLPSRRRQVESEFVEAETLAFFIGYPRSGHTALAALINGHPEALLAHELDLFKQIRLGADKNHLLALIVERDRWFAKRGRQWETYDYNVPLATYGGQPVRVIGDKMAGVSTSRLRHDLSLLEDAQQLFGAPLRVINVVRNPFDNVATIAIKQPSSLQVAIGLYGRLSEGIEAITDAPLSDELLTLRSEDLVLDPTAQLARVWNFLGLCDRGDYVDGAPAFVMSTPSLTRNRVKWSPDDIEAVESLIERYRHLHGYTFGVDGV